MDGALTELLATAFASAEARDANAAIADIRAAGAQGEPIKSYELVVPAGAGLDWLRDLAVPRLVYHLESVRSRPPDYGGLVVSLFTGDKLHFVRAAELLPTAARLLGTSVADLYQRHGTQELRTSVRDDGPALALPPPQGKV